MTKNFFDDAEALVTQALLLFKFDKIYVVRALDSHLPINENGYLVMITEGGDRIAFKAPDSDWVLDNKVTKGYKELASTYEHSIRVYPRRKMLENE
ncbi:MULTISPECIES: hypothetical protein [Serratia]|uniref:hypothetical protein n=1 Tax=Serratia TaxID=613 RepID=UPI002167CA59|nr:MULTISPECIES: hypothetical protein [Serratia]MCS4265921.1 hypothetical protein [Serratia sp. BIGb0163]